MNFNLLSTDLRAQGYSPFTTPPPTPSTTEQGTVDASDGAAATPATLSADAVHAAVGSNPLPDWLAAIADSKDTMEVRLREWEDVAWREAHGWLGTDLIHSSSSAVQMLKYVIPPAFSQSIWEHHLASCASSAHPLFGPQQQTVLDMLTQT